jgi:hypothetical protein
LNSECRGTQVEEHCCKGSVERKKVVGAGILIPVILLNLLQLSCIIGATHSLVKMLKKLLRQSTSLEKEKKVLRRKQTGSEEVV